MLRLYTYFRSSAAYRVRIALNLKGLPYETAAVNLARNSGEQHESEFHGVNPQELIPVLVDGERVIRQSLAIVEYLDETYPGARLLPVTARERARARGLAQLIACDIHPVQNLKVLDRLRDAGKLFWRRDADFKPEKDARTVRLYVSSPEGQAWELLVTGPKWYDTRAEKGGGGGIDLVMHLLSLDFVQSVKLLAAGAGAGVAGQRRPVQPQ